MGGTMLLKKEETDVFWNECKLLSKEKKTIFPSRNNECCGQVLQIDISSFSIDICSNGDLYPQWVDFFRQGRKQILLCLSIFYIKNDLISATTTHEHYHGFHCFEVDENMFSNMRAKFLNECFFSQTEETFFYKWSPWSFHEWVKHFMEWENWN